MLLLAGDVGATKTHLGIFDSGGGIFAPRAEAFYPSQKYPNLNEIIKLFLSGHDVSVQRAVLGVAGPVIRGEGEITNLKWRLSENGLSEALGIPEVKLMNDLLALCWSLAFLGEDDLMPLHRAFSCPEGNMALLAPGTGLGEAFLIWDGQGYRPVPSEGGHADFAPRTRQEVELLSYLGEHFGHVSYDRVCSGLGLPRIYRFLKEKCGLQEDREIGEAIEEAEDPTPLIVEAAKGDRSPLCREAIAIFVRILGAEAGNLALKVLATGGVYLGGGLPLRILPFLQGRDFLEAFFDKGRMSYILRDIPVHVIVRPGAALLGAAAYGFNFTPSGPLSDKRQSAGADRFRSS